MNKKNLICLLVVFQILFALLIFFLPEFYTAFGKIINQNIAMRLGYSLILLSLQLLDTLLILLLPIYLIIKDLNKTFI
ncbi:hypothetical protein P7D23_10080 [Lactococcus petauri]|uniref:hypothetical protein n=1 Tax=Lactococcus TaxID=1357 RepID=UPI001A8C8639|nr:MULTISPECIES: hypothetical protein [Lactococcus]MCO7181345.1 hypothetical protein [Lactococcus formosensis]MDT2527980.1 hypothetical protein [Lactococcus petauri]MDT2552536.1 hypothetical protein [Lactococcus petauri]MDT2561254.1 hypothetical protein [Lactococcus petauri]MDT2563097.1 hypothetical protein [Lactococcus petauri]